jgi:hypothetical protein
VVLGQADGVRSTLAYCARINTLVVLTGFLGSTIRVCSASLNALNPLTNLVSSAIRICSADLLTDVLDAQLVGEAVGVGAADGFAELCVALMTSRTLLVGDTSDWFSDASNDGRRIWHESVEARTLSSLIHNLALGIRSTGSFSARILTPVRDAGKRRRTISVDFTSDEAHVVEAHVTEEAVIVEPAGEHTHPVLASFVVGTTFIVFASQHADAVVTLHSSCTSCIVDARVWYADTFYVRITGEGGRAGADLDVVGSLAESVEAA